MASILDIANEAIFWLGESPITQDEYDNDSNKPAIAMSANYLRVKHQVLFSYPWKVAEKSIRLLPVVLTETEADAKFGITLAGAPSYTGDTYRLFLKDTAPENTYYQSPVFGYKRMFAKPDDLLRIRLCSDSGGAKVPSKIQGSHIHADEDVLYLTYTYDIEEADIDATLASVIARFLASATAPYFGKDDMAPALESEARISWRMAKSADAQQDPTRVFESTDWIEGRLGLDVNTPHPL